MTTRSLRVVLSDLDDTLFDHTHATKASLAVMAREIPELAVWTIDELEARHRVLLDRLHIDVLNGRLTIDEARFERFGTLARDAGAVCDRDRVMALARVYRETYAQVWQAVPGAVALSKAIRATGLKLVIVTNNVLIEQRLKLDRCGLTPLVDCLLTSEEAGFLKPDARIFEIALSRMGVRPEEAVMLGDAWGSDIEGAKAAGIRAVWLNRLGLPSPDPSVPELQSLEDTGEVLRVLMGECVNEAMRD